MLKTSIILEMDGNFPIRHKSTGLAKNLTIATWIFDLLGWKSETNYPDLCYQVARIEWPEGDQYFPSDMTKLWVLGHCVDLN